MTLQEVSEKLIKTKGRIAIFGHVHPDCDAIGSMYALNKALKQLRKKCDMFVDGELSEANKNIFDPKEICKEEIDTSNYKLFIALDLNAGYRLGKYESIFTGVNNKLRIDHHQGTVDFIKDCYVDSLSSSTCEIMYDLLRYLNVDINKEIATYLYAGLATDTNSFMNPNVRANTYKVAEKLYKCGADIALVNKCCFRSITKSGLELTKLFYKKQKMAINDRFAYVIINEKDFNKSCSSYLDAENFSQLLDSVSGVNLAVCATEREKGAFKLSIRSNNSDNDYALRFAKMFEGGGHKQAAGATIIAKKDKQVEKLLLEKAKEILEK